MQELVHGVAESVDIEPARLPQRCHRSGLNGLADGQPCCPAHSSPCAPLVSVAEPSAAGTDHRLSDRAPQPATTETMHAPGSTMRVAIPWQAIGLLLGGRTCVEMLRTR